MHFPQSPGARSARLATRYARGAVAPSGPAAREGGEGTQVAPPNSPSPPPRGGEGWVRRGRAWRRLDPAPATLQAREALSCGIPRCPAGFHLPLSPSQPVRFPQAAGAGFFISLRRRALAPLACLRAIRRGAQSRAPNLRSGTLHGGLLVGRGSRQRQGQDIPLYPGESHDGRGRSTMAGAGPARRTP